MTWRLRNLLVDGPNSVGARTRLRRWEMLQRSFPRFEELQVLDLGGTVETWERSPVRPRHVTVLNLYDPGDPACDWINPVVGDACNAESALTQAGVQEHYDMVYSNSLIEHLGGHARRLEFAQQVRGLAEHHWVQTPYRFFPVEPHWIFPGMQFLPTAARTAIAQHWPLVHTKPESREDACSEALWTELLSATEMRFYFPAATLLREKFLGVTKSLISVM